MSEKIMERIKKLLELANSDNKNEAELAARRAQELITKHNLTERDLTDDDFLEVDIFEGQRKNLDHRTIHPIICRFYYVEMLNVRGCKDYKSHLIIKMYGEEVNVLSALYAYAFLQRTYRSLWEDAMIVDGLGAKQKVDFYLGLMNGLYLKLQSEEKNVIQKSGLVEVKRHPKMDEWIAGSTKSKNARRKIDASAFNSGHKEGVKISIRKPVEDKKDGNKDKLIGNGQFNF